jgi:signal recognition particle GTPase
MNIKIKEMSLKELKAFNNEAVDSRIEERLGDPDVGLEIKPEVIEAIRKSRKSKVTLTAEEVAKRLGLNW